MKHLCVLVYGMFSLVFISLVLTTIGSYIRDNYFTYFFEPLYLLDENKHLTNEMSAMIEMSHDYIAWLLGLSFSLFILLMVPIVISYKYKKGVFVSIIFTIIISFVLWVIVFWTTGFFTNGITNMVEMSKTLYSLYTLASVIIGIVTLGIVYTIINWIVSKNEK